MEAEETASLEYTERLENLEGSLLKRILTPINPYRWNIRRLCPGRVLDVGCGIGRNLRYLKRDDALGVDHNLASVQRVQLLGYKALTVHDFDEQMQSHLENFDSILISHVLEHLEAKEAAQMVLHYLPALKHGGKVIAICPQQRGYKSDRTHKTYFSIKDMEKLFSDLSLVREKTKSFPFPKLFGKFYIYNENIVVYRKI